MSTIPVLSGNLTGDPLAGTLSADDLNRECERAFDEYIGRQTMLVLLLNLLCESHDSARDDALRLVVGLVEREVPGLRMAWLVARRAWADATGLDLDPIDGV